MHVYNNNLFSLKIVYLATVVSLIHRRSPAAKTLQAEQERIREREAVDTCKGVVG
jgi:hypothetical protein